VLAFPKAMLVRRLGVLPAARRHDLCRALAAAVDCQVPVTRADQPEVAATLTEPRGRSSCGCRNVVDVRAHEPD
jgi:hypothetical protein